MTDTATEFSLEKYLNDYISGIEEDAPDNDPRLTPSAAVVGIPDEHLRTALGQALNALEGGSVAYEKLQQQVSQIATALLVVTSGQGSVNSSES